MRPEQAMEAYGYLTTTGRVTGKPHTIEIWFAAADRTIYLLSGSGGTSDWCRNLESDAAATIRIGTETIAVTGRRVETPSEQAVARRVVFDKYSGDYGGDLTEWRDNSAPFALDL